MKKTDIIVVGQGLAGSVLALELMNEGRSVIVIDKPELSASSKVAAGIYNPIVFKRLTQSWLADMVLPVMLDFYGDLETKFQVQLLHHVKITRLYANKDEEELWKKKAVNELTEFIDCGSREDMSGLVKQAGYLDVPEFLERSRAFFIQRNAFVEEKFDHAQVVFEGDNIVYNNITCNKIIFCEGPLYRNNPWFKDLRFKPAKGEILTIVCEDLKADTILNKDIFILPLPKENHFKVGATYDWEDLTDKPTEEGRKTLEEKLKKIIPYKFKVVKHEAGVRPSTIDRRPVIGFHSERRSLGIFNGFGTKAVMLAPYFAKHFCSFMENKTALWQEVDIKRFFLAKAE